MHKKYTYKDGKRFGPYYYATKRVDGNVVTTYLGTKLPHKKIHLSLIKNILLIFAFVLLIISAYFISSNITGNASLDIKTNYNFGEPISGNLELNLLEGELIPANSIVLVEYGNVSREFILSDLISDDLLEGQFYAQGISLSGEGLGYGLPGKMVSYPLVNFDFYISEGDSSNSESQSGSVNEETVSEEQSEQPVQESVSEEQAAQNQESSSSEDSLESNSESVDVGITGAVISDSNIISGVVSKDEDFTYFLSNGQTASLVEGSVNSEGISLEDDLINFDLNGNEILVSTDYSIEKDGFGENYIGDNSKKLLLNIDFFELIANSESDIKISLIYDSNIIVEASDSITISNIELVESIEGNENQEGVTEVPEITNDSILNETINQTSFNETILNETFVNQTQIENITKINETLINGTLVDVKTTQYGAVIGQPVRWVKTVSLDVNNSLNLTVEIPASAENVTINKITEDNGFENVDRSLESSNIKPDLIIGITGEVTADFNLGTESIFDKIFKIFKITGRVIEDETQTQEVSVELLEEDMGVEVEYYTGAPIAIENVVHDNFKTVLVSSPEDIHYENVLVYTNILDSSKIKEISSVRVEWVENGSLLDVSFYNDTNSDGYIDYIEWIAPHLSNQTFNIILIISALHLDENRNFVSDIYNETMELDGYWSENIPDGHYVRVTFERNLTNGNDLTIFPRASNGGDISEITIDVFEKDSNFSIAQFINISENNYNKIFLTNFIGSQDTFDLRIIGGDIEFDHIIDPNQGPGIFVLSSPINGSTTTARSVNFTIQINDTDWVSGTSGSAIIYTDTNPSFSNEHIIYKKPFTLNGTVSFNYSIPPLKYNSTQGIFLLYHFDNNTHYGENLTRVTDFATGKFNATTTNVNGEREISKDGLGLAYELDTGERLTILDDPLLNSPTTTGEITIMFWFNMTTNNTLVLAPLILTKQSTAPLRDYAVFFVNTTKQIHVGFGNTTAGIDRQFATTASFANSTWYHYAFTFNRTTRSAITYINGVVDKSGTLGLEGDNLLIDSGSSFIVGGAADVSTPPVLLDDVALFNRTLSASEILDIYRLREGTYYLRANVSDNGGVFNSSSIYTFTVASNLVPYNGTALVINSTLGLNRTAENLNVRTTLLDLDNNAMNVTVRWYNNSVQHLAIQYNSSYANGTTFIANLSHPNTTKGEVWFAGITLYDGRNSFMVNSSNLTILDSPPNITLLTPLNNSVTANHSSQNFTWAMGDDDSEAIIVLAINFSSLAVSSCDDPLWNGTLLPIIGVAESFNLIPTAPLNCPTYLWSAIGLSSALGDFAPYFRINVTGIEPNVTLNAPDNASIFNFGSSISFNWTANDTGALNMTCNLTIDSLVNQSNIVTPNLTMINRSVSGFSAGSHNWNVSCLDVYGNRGNSITRIFTVNNAPYNGTALVINSTLGLNRTTENLNVRTILLDLNNNSMNVTVRWYKNNSLNFTLQYNSSYANGTVFIATLNNGNTTKGENWSASLTLNDGLSSFNVNSTQLVILNSPPNVTLITQSMETINRTGQEFYWSAVDPDGDNIFNTSFILTILSNPSTCVENIYDGTNIFEGTPGEINTYFYTIPASLPINCFYDLEAIYTFYAQASDGFDGGNAYSENGYLQLFTYLSASMNLSSVNFGNLGYLRSNDTTDNSPQPLIIVNDGNVLSNIKITATNLWNTVSNPSSYFQFKFANVTTNGISEGGTFKWENTTTIYTNVPNMTLSDVPHLVDLNYSGATDSVEIDFNVTVPPTEGPGFKNSTITFTIELGYGDTYEII